MKKLLLASSLIISSVFITTNIAMATYNGYDTRCEMYVDAIAYVIDSQEDGTSRDEAHRFLMGLGYQHGIIELVDMIYDNPEQFPRESLGLVLMKCIASGG